MQDTTTTEPRIYVACLATYNAGRLYGEWIDATQDAEAIHEEIQAMLKASPAIGAEEWAIHDTDHFCGLSVAEHEDIEQVTEWAEALEKHSWAFVAYRDNLGSSEATAEGFEEAYRGEWESEADFAEDYAEQCEDFSDRASDYIDWEKYANDLFHDFYSIEQPDGDVWVFANV